MKNTNLTPEEVKQMMNFSKNELRRFIEALKKQCLKDTGREVTEGELLTAMIATVSNPIGITLLADCTILATLMIVQEMERERAEREESEISVAA